VCEDRRYSLFPIVAAIVGIGVTAASAEDFRWYVRTSEDFRSVVGFRQVTSPERWDRWVLFPWRHDWPRNYDESLVSAMRQAGFNGGVCDWTPRLDADLHEKYGLLWYLDHAAGRGDLHLPQEFSSLTHRANSRRPRCLADPSVQDRLRERLEQAVHSCEKYRTHVAYSLDDEISWSTFTNPCQWDNNPMTIREFRAWLMKRYGSRAALIRQWGSENERYLHRMATPDDFQHLYRRPVTQWNLSPWCDALSFMDSQLLNLVGDLVLFANSLDPATPCGFVGAQGPAPYGGYDYAKLMRKVQFLEVYDIGAAMEIARSLNIDGQAVLVSGGYGDPNGPDGEWPNWYAVAHGYRGNIAYADGWFGQAKDLFRLGPGIRKLAEMSRKLVGTQWRHNGIALYSSHPSIQVSWFMDCQVHGRTWMNRLSSINDQLASTNAAFWAWTRVLEDAGLQYNFVSYADLIGRRFNASEYKVLILPRVLALSDIEVDELMRYVQQGGVLIADHMVGLFDQHGRGRRRPALDELLGITNHPPVMLGNLFGGQTLTEFDAETNWRASFPRAANDIWAQCKRAKGLPMAERQIGPFIAGRHGNGWAMLMNVSLAEYCLYRERQPDRAAETRKVVMELLERAGVKPWFSFQVGQTEAVATEATCWESQDRTYLWIVRNPLHVVARGSSDTQPSAGGTTVRLLVRFARPQTDVVDEVVGKALGRGDTFELAWKTDQAAVISMSKEPQDLSPASRRADVETGEPRS